jgi:hypothetical protein
LSRETILILSINGMDATFVELRPFQRHRSVYLADEEYRLLQQALMQAPEFGELMPGCAGLRKLRWADPRRGKGKRGGLRVIYFHHAGMAQFWLFTLYDKDEMDDLSFVERRALVSLLTAEYAARGLS